MNAAIRAANAASSNPTDQSKAATRGSMIAGAIAFVHSMASPKKPSDWLSRCFGESSTASVAAVLKVMTNATPCSARSTYRGTPISSIHT
jgi:hypothetical protein